MSLSNNFPTVPPSFSIPFTNVKNLDSRVTVTRALDTATYTDSTGIIRTALANTPRFDYDPATLAPRGLLIEEQRTNLLLRSEEFDNAAWVKTDATVTPNVVVAPDGTTTGDALVTSAAANPNVQQSLVGPQTGVAMVLSFYARAGTTSEVNGQLFVNAGVPSGLVTVTGTIISGPGSINSSAATSGLIRVTGLSTTQWTRIAITGTSTATAGNLTGYIKNRLSGATVGDTAYIWGAQLEVGSFATSYIPTVASQVTRNADSAVITGANFSSWYNATEGTLYAEYDAYAPLSGAAFGVAALNDGTASNRTYLFLGGGTASPSLIVTSAGAAQANINNSAISANTTAKTAGTYAVNDFAIATNAGTVATDVSGALPVGLSKLDLGGFLSGAFLNGHLRRITYYPTRLTNTLLQTLTSS